ncbi:MAG: fused MFS/spermidine synthase [Nocardioidaceae bacterium]
MKTTRHAKVLLLIVFVVGMATLGAEIAAARLLAPWFGASTIVWANTIAIVLVALSIGYAIGGRYADRHPHLDGLLRLVLIAGLLLAAVPYVARPFLRLGGRLLRHVLGHLRRLVGQRGRIGRSTPAVVGDGLPLRGAPRDGFGR